ncbi:MAG: histidine phosphatase family protein [Nitrospiria bacterium]
MSREKIREKEEATTLVFFRHGKTDFPEERFYSRTEDPSLNAEGESQAARLGRWVKGASFSALYASPLKRTMQTAGYLSEGFNLKLLPKAGLEERTMGAWDGLTPSEAREMFPEEFLKWKSDPMHYAPPGGESWMVFAERIIKTVAEIKENHPRQRVAVVTHVGPIRVIVCRAMEIKDENHKRIVLGYGSATRIDYTKKWGNLCYLGMVPFEQQP